VVTETLGEPLTFRVRSKLASAAKAVAAARVRTAAVETKTLMVIGFPLVDSDELLSEC